MQAPENIDVRERLLGDALHGRGMDVMWDTELV